MPRAQTSISSDSGARRVPELTAEPHLHGRAMTCVHCMHGLECVEQNRRSGTWVGSFICPNCRSEYFYGYRWGRLLKKV